MSLTPEEVKRFKENIDALKALLKKLEPKPKDELEELLLALSVREDNAPVIAKAIRDAGYRKIPKDWQGCPAQDPWFGELCLLDPKLHHPPDPLPNHRSIALGVYRNFS